MIFFPYKRDDLEDIRKEIEKDEEHFHAGPLKTKSELSVKVHVHVTSSSLNAH